MPQNLLYQKYQPLFTYTNTLKSSSFHYEQASTGYTFKYKKHTYAILQECDQKVYLTLFGPRRQTKKLINTHSSISQYNKEEQWFTIALESCPFNQQELFKLVRISHNLIWIKSPRRNSWISDVIEIIIGIIGAN